jgi:Ser/Thr protein kinase RdoA (MazF antagonist)
MVHLDLAVAEFAHTWRGRYDAFIEGFEEVTPLTDQERALIPPVRWAWLIGSAQHELLRQETPDLRWTMQQLKRRSPRMRF